MEKYLITKSEGINFFKNSKIYVNGKSKEIQEILFKCGIGWPIGSFVIQSTSAPFLIINDKRYIYSCVDMNDFSICSYKEIKMENITKLEVVDDIKENEIYVCGWTGVNDYIEYIIIADKTERASNIKCKVAYKTQSSFNCDRLNFNTSVANSTYIRKANEKEISLLKNELKNESNVEAIKLLTEVFNDDSCIAPFTKVLVRNSLDEKWSARFFDKFIDGMYECTDGNIYKYLKFYDEK